MCSLMQVFFFIILFTILNALNELSFCWLDLGKKTQYNMSNFVLLSNFSLFWKTQDSLDDKIRNSLCNWRRWFLCSFLSLFVNIKKNKKISIKLLYLCYIMFLDTWIIVLSIYEYLMLLFIFLFSLVYFLRFLGKQIQFCV